MSRSSNRSYHEARAEDEMQLAEQASEPAVAEVHRELAAMHRRMMMEIVEKPSEPAGSPPDPGGRAR